MSFITAGTRRRRGRFLCVPASLRLLYLYSLNLSMKNWLPLLLLVSTLTGTSQIPATLFEKSNGTQSPPYADIIKWWQQLDAASGKVKLLTMGPSDAGFPLHLAVVANNGDFNFENIRRNYWVI